MEMGTMIKGGIGVVALYGICRTIKYMTTPIPITAEEMAKQKFDPARSPWDHPFFDEWASVDKNMETLETLQRRCVKYLKRNLNGRQTIDELDQDEMTALYIASTTKVLNEVIQKQPEAIMEALGEECEFELEGDGSMLWDPFADPSNVQDSADKEKAKTRQNNHRKNAKMLRKIVRKLATRVMESLMYNSALAEDMTKLLKGHTNMDDLSSETINEIFISEYAVLPQQFRNEVENASTYVFKTLI